MDKKRAAIYNILFLLFSAALLLFLWNSPPETTVKLPRDIRHIAFYKMGKKEAERHCETCHSKAGGMPLPKKHPPKYRCLFCHKKMGNP